MKLNIFQKKSAGLQQTKNPVDFVRTSALEPETSLLQLFHKLNYRVLEPFYNFAIRDSGAENILCIVAIQDFEMFPKTEKRDFIVRTFFDASGAFEVNINSGARNYIKQQLAMENAMKANARRNRSGAFIRYENRAPTLSQSGGTFGNVLHDLEMNLADTWGRYVLGDEPAKIAAPFLQCQQCALAMQAAGILVPQFMFTMKGR